MMFYTCTSGCSPIIPLKHSPSCFHFAACPGIHKFGRLIVSAVRRPGAGHHFNSDTSTKQLYGEIHSHF